jgi:cytoskeletal protein RodZ
MANQPDDKLKKRVKEVFDNYDDASAHEGWLLLRKKFPVQRRRPVLWLWPAAAVLLLFLGLGIWMYGLNNKPAGNTKVSYHIKAVKPEQPASLQHQIVVTHQNQAGAKQGNALSPAYKTIPARVARLKPAVAKPSSPAIVRVQNQAIAKHVNHPVINPPQAAVASKTNKIAAVPADTAKNLPGTNATGIVANARQNATAPDTSAKQVAAVKPKPKTIEDLFAADAGKPPLELKDNKDKKVRFGVYAATYFNYARGSNNQVNAGAGFTADIKLTGNLKLVTGLSVNQNSFAYNNSGLFGTSANLPYYNNLGGNGTADTYTQSASLVGLDVPLDLKYEFNSRKSQVYVLAGVGSGTFINESYSYIAASGSYPAPAGTTKGFGDFYFARTLNMAFGLGYPLGKDQIVIEPFVKYPLQGLGAEDLHFGASGINLKFNFSIKK